ncbi:MAG: glutathione S-transferase N-terminal domain-containing protein [Pseudomonadota bacterium]
MKLLASGPSPFAAKAALAARHLNADVTVTEVDATNQAPELLAANPLGKIPCLVLDNGKTVFDSRAILRFLDRENGNRLFPSDHAALTAVEYTESLCDGICEAAVANIYEMRFRPEEKVHKPWQERQLGKMYRGLDALMADLPPSSGDLTAGSLGCAAAISYLNLRYPGEWEDGRSELANWLSDFSAANPTLADLLPAA